jgi:hypothetical protein
MRVSPQGSAGPVGDVGWVNSNSSSAPPPSDDHLGFLAVDQISHPRSRSEDRFVEGDGTVDVVDAERHMVNGRHRLRILLDLASGP